MPLNADQMTKTDYMDAFGTLLAVKLPGQKGALDRRYVPIDDFFEELCLLGEGPWAGRVYRPDSELLSKPWVFLNDRQGVLERQPMPTFSHGQPENSLKSESPDNVEPEISGETGQ